MEKYMIISPIGEGSFAKVYRGREKFTGRVRIIYLIKFKRKDSFVRMLH
jgi:serine/threonine protein kinase